MIKELSIQIPQAKEKDQRFILEEILSQLEKSGIKCREDEITPVFLKKSIDARRRVVKLFLKYKVYIGEKPAEEENSLPQWKKADGSKTVVIVGSGPAGLFGALRLLEKGIKPVIVERGSDTAKRKRQIAEISTRGILNAESNYCYGEGGAGTFSDGKLYTRSNKRGDIGSVLRIFAHFGADKRITTDAHPHIGTDRLPKVINSMREFIIQMGGEFHFDTKCIGFVTEESEGKKKILGVECVDAISGEKSRFLGDAVLLATGHSANDIYEILARTESASLEAKTFAVGVRAEHPREVIDSIQYGGKQSDSLGAAEYRLTSQQDGRGVYTFCMCPGGFVVPSASSPEQIVVNGMSAAGRNSKWSNAAVVVETRPEDIPEEFAHESEKQFGSKVLAGLLWRTWLEKKTFENGDNQKAPAQRLEDFLSGTDSDWLPESSYTPGLVPSRLDKWLPQQIARRLKEGFRDFNRYMHGYICKNALLIATETRTSTPVRILRDKESGQSVCLENLYPAGEGSGYSGGIVSSAMDGENQCDRIIERLFSSQSEK